MNKYRVLIIPERYRAFMSNRFAWLRNSIVQASALYKGKWLIDLELALATKKGIEMQLENPGLRLYLEQKIKQDLSGNYIVCIQNQRV